MDAVKKRKVTNVKWTLFCFRFISNRYKLTTTSQMMEAVYKGWPNLPKDSKNKDMYMQVMSGALGILVKNNYLKVTRQPGVRYLLYGLPEWFDETGKIKPEHDIDILELI